MSITFSTYMKKPYKSQILQYVFLYDYSSQSANKKLTNTCLWKYNHLRKNLFWISCLLRLPLASHIVTSYHCCCQFIATPYHPFSFSLSYFNMISNTIEIPSLHFYFLCCILTRFIINSITCQYTFPHVSFSLCYLTSTRFFISSITLFILKTLVFVIYNMLSIIYFLNHIC